MWSKGLVIRVFDESGRQADTQPKILVLTSESLSSGSQGLKDLVEEVQ